jgi:hypothetical protein
LSDEEDVDMEVNHQFNTSHEYKNENETQNNAKEYESEDADEYQTRDRVIPTHGTKM